MKRLMRLRYGKLDFNKAPWTEIQAQLEAVADANWNHMGKLFKVSPTAALVGFHEKVLGIFERLVPEKRIKVEIHIQECTARGVRSEVDWPRSKLGSS